MTGSCAAGRAAHDRAKAGEELVDAERLRHVVVRARVERSDLLVLLTDGGEDDHRRVAPRAQLARDLGSVPVREDEVDDHGLRRVRGRRGQRVGRVGCRVDRVPGAAERRSERPQDLRLVVDDEDALARHTAISTGASTTGSASAKVAPCSGRDSAHTRPPFAAANPRAIARPSPAPPPFSAAAAVEGLEDPLELRLGQPGALVDDPDNRLLPRRGDAHEHARAGWREGDRVLDEVREHALDLSGVDVHERCLADDLHTVARAQRIDGLPDDVVERPELGLRRGASRLEPRKVEQVADEPAEPLRVDLDRVEKLGAVGVAELERAVAKRADRRSDPGERRSQVMRDGTEERRLDEVAAPERLRLERVPLEPILVERDGEQRGERGQEAPLREDVRIRVRVDRADGAAGGLERIRRLAGRPAGRRHRARGRPSRRRAPRRRGSRSPAAPPRGCGRAAGRSRAPRAAPTRAPAALRRRRGACYGRRARSRRRPSRGRRRARTSSRCLRA